MAFVRIDEIYINLDNVTLIEVYDSREEVEIYCGHEDGEKFILYGEKGARLLKWLDAGGSVSEAGPLTPTPTCVTTAHPSHPKRRPRWMTRCSGSLPRTQGKHSKNAIGGCFGLARRGRSGCGGWMRR